MDSVVIDSWIMILTSPNHYTKWGQNLAVLIDLAWNEKRPSLLSIHFLKIYIPWPRSHPKLGAYERYFEDTNRINGYNKGLEQNSNDWERARKGKAIDRGPSMKTLRKAI